MLMLRGQVVHARTEVCSQAESMPRLGNVHANGWWLILRQAQNGGSAARFADRRCPRSETIHE